MHRTCRPAPADGYGGALTVKSGPLVLTMGNHGACAGSEVARKSALSSCEYRLRVFMRRALSGRVAAVSRRVCVECWSALRRQTRLLLVQTRSIGWQAELDVRLNEAAQYRLVIADDHPLFRGALREAVSGLVERTEIAEAGTIDEVARLLDSDGDVDLILLDLTMPGVRGFSGLMYLRAQFPSVPIVIVSANDDPVVIRRCMDFGASGFIPKTLGIEAMRGAIARVFEGGVWTPPDIDLGAGSDAGTADLMVGLAGFTPPQGRALVMLS